MNQTIDEIELEQLDCDKAEAEAAAHAAGKAGRTASRRVAVHDIEPGADWNDVEHAILTRRSIRKFKGRQVPAHMVRRIIEMGRFAPSQGNCQPWAFVVVRDKALIAEMEASCVAVCKTMTENIDYTNYPEGSEQRAAIMANTQAMNRQDPNAFHPVPMTAIKSIANGRFAVFHKAPTLILILMDTRGVGVPAVDIGVAGTNIVLAAQSLGLGTCWIGFSKLLSNFPDLLKKLDIAPPFEIAEAICVGYPIGNPAQQEISRQTHRVGWWEDGKLQELY